MLCVVLHPRGKYKHLCSFVHIWAGWRKAKSKQETTKTHQNPFSEVTYVQFAFIAEPLTPTNYICWTKRPAALEIHRMHYPGKLCVKDSSLMPSQGSSSMHLCHSWQQPDIRATTRARATLSARLWCQGMTRRVGVACGGAQPSQGTHHRQSGCSCLGAHSKWRL